MPWPASTHGDVEDAVTALRSPYVTGVWITQPGTASTGSLSVGNATYVPMWLPGGVVSDVGMMVTAAATGGSGGTIAAGLYNTAGTLDSTYGRVPGTLLTSLSVSSETTGVKSVSPSLTVTPGLYWCAMLATVAGCTVRNVAEAAATGLPGTADIFVHQGSSFLTKGAQTSLAGTAPAPSGTITAAGRLYLRFSSFS